MVRSIGNVAYYGTVYINDRGHDGDVVRIRQAGYGEVPYFLFAYTGMVTVLLLVNMVSNGLPGIVANMNLPKSSNSPRRVAGADGWDISISLESQNAGKFS